MRAAAIAAMVLAGFDRHYALFRYNAQQAKARWEHGDWHGIRRLARERIEFYDLRVREAVSRLESEFAQSELTEGIWSQVKRHYVAALSEHRQPELAETFFNSVSTKILHRSYFRNDFIFVRPAVSTEHLDAEPPSWRVYYPHASGLAAALRALLIDLGLACPYVDAERDVARMERALAAEFGAQFEPAADWQIQVLRTLFFRNKGAYLIGRIIDDGEVRPFVVPWLRDSRGRAYADAMLFGEARIEALFNFSRAYFMVDMDVPSAYVRFLRSLMPAKPESELYTMLGLHKQGKTLFYRDLLHHLRHSHDRFVAAPGIRGLVMAVFTLPSFPYVFKLIKDRRSKEAAPSLIEDDGESVVIRHLYIERRMTPLNLHLERSSEAERERAIIEYGNAIREMVAANIFPGDMLYKNFGVTRQGRIVFYDYAEVAYLTDCNFREMPSARTPEDEMASEPWYAVGPNDVFPEEFGTFLLGHPAIRAVFTAHHGELLEAGFWRARQARIREGVLEDVFPYPEALRFRRVSDPDIPNQEKLS